MDMTPSSSGTFGTAIGTGMTGTPTPSGATRMAVAAKERAKGKVKAGRYDDKEGEEYPLSESALALRWVFTFFFSLHLFIV